MWKGGRFPAALEARATANITLRRLTLSHTRSTEGFGRLLLALALAIAAAPMGLATASEPSRNLGTGFFISGEGHFVTASHVIGGCKSSAVLTPGGVMPADLVARSKEKDVAVIKTSGKTDAYGRFTADPRRAVRRALTVTRFLHRGGLASGSTTTGRFLGVTSAEGGRFAMRAKDKIAGGNSGAPVVDYRGGIVGMMVARAQKDARVGIAVDVFAISEFLSQSGIKIETVAGGEYDSPAGGGGFTRTYTFPVVCVAAEKKKESNPE